MPKRVVDTKFWTSADVLDHYSVEDKYFYLYLVTNGKSTQLGIYSIPKKVISFETGFTIEAIDVLIDRFEKSYKKIIYDSETQEIALVDSLKWSLLKGGKPVQDLLSRELSQVKQDDLIQETYECMKSHWRTSSRVFDQTIMEIFEQEMTNREISFEGSSDQSKQNINKNIINNYNQQQNHHQDSQATIRENAEAVDKSIGLVCDYSLTHIENFYKRNCGPLTPKVEDFLKEWSNLFDWTILLEALHRSQEALSPMNYAETILERWKKQGVKNLQDIKQLDTNFFG